MYVCSCTLHTCVSVEIKGNMLLVFELDQAESSFIFLSESSEYAKLWMMMI